MIQQNAQILWNKAAGPLYYHLGLQCRFGYAESIPGQFVMLRVTDQLAPLLRRPFSIHRLIYGNAGVEGLEILYKVVGCGTRKLANLKKGDRVDLVGPLGNGFSIAPDARRIFIAAGGIGVAPMVFLAHHLHKNRFDLSAVEVFLGGRSKADLLCRQELEQLGVAVHVTTDDGSQGDQCLLTHPLELAVKLSPPDIIYACGPMGMLKCIVGIAETYRVACQVSIETMMACGIGACLGCAVKRKQGHGKYLHACLDGPVFDLYQIEL